MRVRHTKSASSVYLPLCACKKRQPRKEGFSNCRFLPLSFPASAQTISQPKSSTRVTVLPKFIAFLSSRCQVDPRLWGKVMDRQTAEEPRNLLWPGSGVNPHKKVRDQLRREIKAPQQTTCCCYSCPRASGDKERSSFSTACPSGTSNKH